MGFVEPGGVRAPDRYVVGASLVLGGFSVVAGVWALVSPSSFADFVEFPNHEHFLHDIGAFQIGIGVMLLLALIWRDAVALALTAFLVGNTIHTVNHIVDLDLGGSAGQAWLLGALELVALVALRRRLKQLGYVVGRVSVRPAAAMAPFAQQKTVLLTTYRRDGTAVPTPVSVAVDSERAFVRSFEKAGKTRRVAGNPAVAVTPCRTRGQVTGPAVEGQARRLEGPESSEAARLLRYKYPLLHGVVVPLTHRAFRSKTGRTVHFELTLR